MRSLPPLTALRAFESAARNLSFKGAAEELHLTPTAISHQIRVLETYVGQPLFQRLPRPVTLTGAGSGLYLSVREAFHKMGGALHQATRLPPQGLRVTTTNAFAALCLLPNLGRWQAEFPDVPLSIIGTDNVLDLSAGEADLAIRYARSAPAGTMREICRDRHIVVVSPKLANPSVQLTPAEIARYPLIEAEWPDWAIDPPTWCNWVRIARLDLQEVPDMTSAIRWRFREELHAIEAAIAGQGIAICSNVLAHDALSDGRLVAISNIAKPGYGFFAVPRPDQAGNIMVQKLADWLCTNSNSSQPPE